MRQIFFVGSYTEANGRGIYTCTLESSTGQMQVKSCFEACKNPSYLAVDEENRRLFAVQEDAADLNPAVHVLNIDEQFVLTPSNSRGVPGGAPCYLALDADKRFLTVANYSTGNVLLYPVHHDGTLGELADDVDHADYYTGRGTNLERQEGPHPHATVFGPDNRTANRTVYVPDLGTDEIAAYRLNADGAKLELLSRLKLPAGAGPRQLAFHPAAPVAFVVSELDSSLSVLYREGDKLTLLNSVSTLPTDFSGVNTCAAVRVHPSGDFVYASNRGDDSIAVFRYERATQRLLPIHHVSTQGQLPRDFALDPKGRVAVVANQQTNNLVSFWVDGQTGRLEPTGQQVEVGTPTCVALTKFASF